MCECYRIGRFIAEDPDCPVHGTEAQERDRERKAERDADQAELLSLQSQIADLREQLSAVKSVAETLNVKKWTEL
jgi:hypothetical protein